MPKMSLSNEKDGEEVAKLLSTVTKLRKIIPTKIMKLEGERINWEINAIMNAKIEIEDDSCNEQLKKSLERYKQMKVPDLSTLEYDIATQRLNDTLSRIEELKHYLTIRQGYPNHLDEIREP